MISDLHSEHNLEYELFSLATVSIYSKGHAVVFYRPSPAIWHSVMQIDNGKWKLCKGNQSTVYPSQGYRE